MMLWYKAWLETRWRFLLGFALLVCSAAATVYAYRDVANLLPSLRDVTNEQIREAAALAATYRGYVWSTWFRQNLCQWATLFAAILGTSRVFSHSDGALFTLSMPLSRNRILGVRAMTGLGELLMMTAVSSLAIPLFSTAIHQQYAISATLLFVLCAFVALSVFFCFALFLSTIFDDPWRPMLIVVAVAVVLAQAERALHSEYGIFRVMSGEAYFRANAMPWSSLIIALVLSSAFYVAASVSTARRDF